MRFKAKLAPEQVSLLYQLCVPLAKIATFGGSGGGSGNATAVDRSSVWTRNGSIIYIDTSFMRISTKGKSSETDSIQCFAELATTGGIFLEHRIESINNNQIVMEIDLVQFRMALQSFHERSRSSEDSPHQQHYCTVLKLAKRNGIPCLCLDAVTSSTKDATNLQVHHSIPIRILRPNEMKQYMPPPISQPDIQLELTKPLRPVIEGLKLLSPTVYLEGTARGELIVSLDSDGASIRTYFNNLRYRHEDCKPNVSTSTVKVDTKKLASCLVYHPSVVSSSLLCLVDNEMLVLHVTLHPSSVGFFTYYIPVHYLSLDPADE